VSGSRARTFSTIATTAIVVAVVFGGIGYALLHGRGSARHGVAAGSRTSDAGDGLRLPPQVVQPVRQVIGQAMPQPSTLRARFAVEPNSSMSLDSKYPGDWTVEVYPADAKTIAGAGSVSAGAPFAQMGGLAIADGRAYVATGGGIVRVDVKSGHADVLAGSATEQACVDSADPDAVRFRGPPGDLVAGGGDLYVANGCGIARVDIRTGATTSLTKWAGPLAFGPDGELYAGTYRDDRASIVQVDPSSGAQRTYMDLPGGAFVMGLAADSNALWVSVDEGPSVPAVIDSVAFRTRAVTRYALRGVDVAGFGQLASTGDYLDAPMPGGLGVEQFDKRTGTWGQAAGGEAGDQDGVWANASFGGIRAVASDGGVLYVTDAPNHQVRLVEFNQLAALHMGG
jgi:hypothetical protein